MHIYFRCSSCEQKIKTNFRHRGEALDCPTCELELEVPFINIGPGVMINGFLIEEKIGEGGMGTVYRAIQKSMNRSTALKVLASYLTYDDSSVERFLKEAQTMAALRHPNLVAAYDAGEDDDVYYIAMEFVQGETLESRLIEQGAMDEDEAIAAMTKLAGGLHYAWRQCKMIHRDIKPANIMIDLEQEPRLLDLGLARSLDSMGERITMVGEVLGTPDYMSPEQERGEHETDFRSDIFSLGMTLISMLTGQLPERLPDPANPDTIYGVKDPRSLNPNISENCIRLLAGMLGKAPEDRFEDWEQVLDALTDLGSISLPAGATSLLQV